MGLEKYLQSAKKSLFRFEYLQEFDIPEEHELFRTYKASGVAEIRPLMQDWWKFLENKHAEGVQTQRVRFVEEPFTDYVKWELHIHQESIKRGDDIRILKKENFTPELMNLGDFWLIDDSIALQMDYGPSGEYLGFKEVEPKPYIQAKEYLLNYSKPI